jgi:hypothetical protein
VILQQNANQRAEFLGVLLFKVSPSQSIVLNTFYFCGLSVGEIGTGVLPFSIIPPRATSASTVRAMTGNHVNNQFFYLSADPLTGALSTINTQCLQKQNATFQPIGLNPECS